jgi:hypothetical protein
MVCSQKQVVWPVHGTLTVRRETARDNAAAVDISSTIFAGTRPDYGSGRHMSLLAAAVDLARRDLSNPSYSAECRVFLKGDLVALLLECLGTDRSFDV